MASTILRRPTKKHKYRARRPVYDGGLPVPLDQDALVSICKKYRISELFLFGSVLRSDFNPVRSDVDVLIEFLPDALISKAGIRSLKSALEKAFHRKVDILPKERLSPYITDDVLQRRVAVCEFADGDVRWVFKTPDQSIRENRGFKKPNMHLFNIVNQCQRILKTTSGQTAEDFETKEGVQEDIESIIIWSLERIGFSMYNLSKSFKGSHPEVNWHSWIRLGWRIAHDSQNVEMTEVWAAAEQIPELLTRIEALIRDVVVPTSANE